MGDDIISSEDDISQDISIKQKGKNKILESSSAKVPEMIRPGKRKSYDLADLIASAEDYEQLIEEDNANNVDDNSGNINAVFNKDKSSAKQLKWEAKRRNGPRGNIKKPTNQKFRKA